MNNEIKNKKNTGRVYTPAFIVKNILDLSGYYKQSILKKHVIDNSCGDGAFLVEIVKRYCEITIDKTELKRDLETYIHGIEIDSVERAKCIKNLNNAVSEFGIENIHWDIQCADSLTIDKYNGKMDFVLGNPPYVRVHNLGDNFEEVKRFSYAQNGMTDLYIVFFELGLRMLNASGVLGYITPSSYFNSVAGSYMRKKLIENNLIDKIVDLRHFQAFEATTYTAITILKKKKNSSCVDYYRFDEKNLFPYYVDSLKNSEYYIANNFYFSDKKSLILLKKIFNNLGRSDIAVKNGYATLCDTVFINEFPFDSPYILPVVKASTGATKKIFYPYDKKSNLLKEEELRKDEKLYLYLLSHKEQLLNRSSEQSGDTYWYAFGRSQAINDTYKNKLAINALLRGVNDWKMLAAPAGTGVYSGLYILSDTISISDIKKTLRTEEFLSYIALLGKYKSGGYYTFSSKDVKAYLDYKFAYNGGLLYDDK